MLILNAKKAESNSEQDSDETVVSSKVTLKGEPQQDSVLIGGSLVTQEDVNYEVGSLLQDWITAILEEVCLHFRWTIEAASLKERGRDHTVYDEDDNIIAVFEVLNWNFHTYMTDERAHRIRKNLRGFKIKGIFWTFENYRGNSKTILRHIPKHLLGVQYVTQRAYDYMNILKPWKIPFCELQEPSSFVAVKEQVLAFLADIGLIPHVPSTVLQHDTSQNTDSKHSIDSKLKDGDSL